MKNFKIYSVQKTFTVITKISNFLLITKLFINKEVS